jgi:DNA-binding NtrC family response regulator
MVALRASALVRGELNATLIDVETAIIRTTLMRIPSVRGAARELRIPEATLRSKMSKLGIRAPKTGGSAR